MIKNKRTGQMYIGQSTNTERRFIQHKNIHPVDIDIANEGIDNFVFTVIEELHPNELNERERYWIKYYNTYKNQNHYNQTAGTGYDLWDTAYCHYNKNAMFDKGRIPNPCRCFKGVYDGYRIPFGQFHDFETCRIINQLIKEAIKDEVE